MGAANSCSICRESISFTKRDVFSLEMIESSPLDNVDLSFASDSGCTVRNIESMLCGRSRSIDTRDLLTTKTSGTEALASRFPFNAAKPAEHEPTPPRGQSAEPDDTIVGASTVSEGVPNQKVGDGVPPAGYNPSNGPLDRVRVDQLLSLQQDAADRAGNLTRGLEALCRIAGEQLHHDGFEIGR